MARTANGRSSVRVGQDYAAIPLKLTFSVADERREINAYLQDLEESEVRSLAEVIDYNIKHADKELPPRMLLSHSPHVARTCSSLTRNSLRSPATRYLRQFTRIGLVYRRLRPTPSTPEKGSEG
jgi:hypothetical protein